MDHAQTADLLSHSQTSAALVDTLARDPAWRDALIRCARRLPHDAVTALVAHADQGQRRQLATCRNAGQAIAQLPDATADLLLQVVGDEASADPGTLLTVATRPRVPRSVVRRIPTARLPWAGADRLHRDGLWPTERALAALAADGNVDDDTVVRWLRTHLPATEPVDVDQARLLVDGHPAAVLDLVGLHPSLAAAAAQSVVALATWPHLADELVDDSRHAALLAANTAVPPTVRARLAVHDTVDAVHVTGDGDWDRPTRTWAALMLDDRSATLHTRVWLAERLDPLPVPAARAVAVDLDPHLLGHDTVAMARSLLRHVLAPTADDVADRSRIVLAGKVGDCPTRWRAMDRLLASGASREQALLALEAVT